MAILNGPQARAFPHARRLGLAVGRHAGRFGWELRLLAARHPAGPAEDVGRAAALFAASMFVCYLTSLGLPIAVSRYAPDRTEGSATLFAWSLVLRIAASLAAVAVFIAIAPESIREGFATWRPGFAWLVVFLLVAGQSIAELVDVRLMALRRWSLVFFRSLLIAVVRLPFLLWVPDSGAAFYLYVVALGASRSPEWLSSHR